MLRVQGITHSFGIETVLQDVSYVLNDAQRAGLVGPNGSGKSTLMRIIAGEMVPDSGSVWIDPHSRVAYLPQYPQGELDLSVREALLRGAGAVGEAQRRVRALELALQSAQGDRLDALLGEYARARECFETLGGYSLEARMEAVVQGLAIDVLDLDAPVRLLSGGNKTKVSLARLLLSGADILLLDEPTNYLDLPALLWLERFVARSDHAYLIVSHDRRFLDRTVDTIFELDAESHTLHAWPGTYSDYAAAKEREREKQQEAYADQQAQIRRVEEDIRRTKEQARGVEERTKSGLGADVQRRLAKKVAKKAKARERRLEKMLESEDRIEKPRQTWGLHLADLGRNRIEDDRIVADIGDLHAGYDGREVLRGIDLLIRGRDRLALLGENGSGKSTLIRCMTGALPYRGTIRLGPSVRAGLLSQETEELPLERRVVDLFRSRTEMREDEARTYLHKFLFSGDQALKQIRSLSYGQRAKLALAMLVLSGANFLILDEPTSHMDMPALEAIERALADYRGPMMVVSHDRYFLERIGVNRVAVLEDGGLREVDSVDAYEQEVAA
jgi:ATPase subunit of ABC transporter with duplicated ATPase domains